MKSFIFAVLALLAMSFASCTQKQSVETIVENDTTEVDTILIDSLITDSIATYNI